MIYYARIDGQETSVRIEKKGDRYDVIIGERHYEVDAKYIENSNSLSLLVNSKCYDASVAVSEGSALVSISGEKFEIDLMDELSFLAGAPTTHHGSTGAEIIKTPMPGVIVAVEVEPGQKIDAGAPVVVVEAMKMQNEIASICGGVVKEILVRQGDVVESNQRLAVIERA